jgi:hypothetical protein
LLFLAREGLSYAMLKHMPGAEQAEVSRREEEKEGPEAEQEPRERARVAR